MKLTKTLTLAIATACLAATGCATAAPPPGGLRIDAEFGDYGSVRHFAGEDDCWYHEAWRGPGWYQCGAQWRDGFGWRGPYGWHGWRLYRHHYHPHHPHAPHPGPRPGRPPVEGPRGPGKPPTGGQPDGQPGGPPAGGPGQPRGPR